MKVLVIVAHPDDEALGCGGTIAKHIINGDSVSIIYIADGSTSRGEYDKNRFNSAVRSMEMLGNTTQRFLSYPDNKLDTVSLLELASVIGEQVGQFKPDIVYTHASNDLNIDHQRTHEATITACRPQPGCSVKKILCFEVASSTEWRGAFNPNYFVDISETLEKKLEALHCYDGEMRDFPHARSYKAVESLAYWRGANVGVMAAEAFEAIRIIE